jgi:hypothetical protein
MQLKGRHTYDLRLEKLQAKKQSGWSESTIATRDFINKLPADRNSTPLTTETDVMNSFLVPAATCHMRSSCG